MKYGLIPENPIEQNGLADNPQIKTIFDPFIPALISRSLITAVEIGLFESITAEPLTIDQISQKLSINETVLEMLVRVLISSGYINKEKDKYGLSDLSRLTLIENSPVSFANWVKLQGIQLQAVNKMGQVLLTGKNQGFHDEFGDARNWEIYQKAMLETARPAADWVASQVPISSNPELMLDIGGSHGLYSAAICRANPPLRAEILELPEALESAQNIAKNLGLCDLLSYREGNVLEIDFGHDMYDAVFLGNIIHHFSEEQNQMIFDKIKNALKNNGTIAIWDFRKPEADAAPDIIADCFALFFQITSASQCFSNSEILSWLNAAKFAEIEIHPAPTHNLITARKK